MQRLGTILRIAAIAVGVILGALFAANELVTSVDTKTGRRYDLTGREIHGEDRHHRYLVNPLTRAYDALYYVAGAAIVGGLWYFGTRCQSKQRAKDHFPA